MQAKASKAGINIKMMIAILYFSNISSIVNDSEKKSLKNPMPEYDIISIFESPSSVKY